MIRRLSGLFFLFFTLVTYAEEKMITVGVNLQEISIDPFTDGNFQQATIADLVFEPLIYIDENLNTISALAKSWKINSTGNRYTFKLKSNIKFHDGTLLTSEDVVATFKKHLSANSNSFRKSEISEILKEENGNFDSSIIAKDESTVEFVLKGAYPPFLDILSGIYIVPKKFNPAKPIGCGPFMVEVLNKSEVLLKRTPSEGFIKSNIQKIKFEITQTEEFKDKLESGYLDLTLQAPLALALNPPKNYSVFSSHFDLVSVVFYFNFNRKIYQNKNVREFIQNTLYLARKHEGFLSKFDRDIDHLIPHGMMPPEYYITSKKNKIKMPTNFPKKLRILAPNTFLTEKAIFAIKHEFNIVGVDVEFFLGKGKQLHEPAAKGEFDLALLPYEGMVRDPDAFMFLITPSAPIISFFNLPTKEAIDALNKIKFESDKEKRLKGYAIILNKIETDFILVPIFGQNMPFLYSKKIIPPKSHVMTLISLRFFNLNNENEN